MVRPLKSLSFRLYLLIIPTTILAFALLEYMDTRVSMRKLDDRARNETLFVANRLAQDLASRSVSSESLLPLLYDVLTTNIYIRRIDIYQMSDDGLARLQSTSNSSSHPITVDELAAIRSGRTVSLEQYQDRQRFEKIIVPFSNPAGAKGCVSVVSTLQLADSMRQVHENIALYLIPGTALALILILHYLFTRRVTGRIDRLAEVMTQAKRGDLQKRAKVEADDELGTIAERFNDMMEEIERRTSERDRLLDEQKDFNAQLQLRVAEATRESSTANERLRQLNQDLIEAQRRLTQSERAAVAGQMAATFAHEIGSPLSAISTHLELMAETQGSSAETKRRVELMRDQVNRITGFVEELLSETRATAQPRSAVQLNGLLEQLLLFLDEHLQKNQITVESHFCPELPEIDANPQQLQQVFLNLLNNACDAMPHGGTIRIATSLEGSPEEGLLAVVRVSDNGVGIAPEKQERIFEPFFTTKDLGRGTGLGLSIAAKIVRRHDGDISLESEPDRGTTFTIRFRLPARTTTGPADTSTGDARP